MTETNESNRFTFTVSKEPTGRMQFRTDGAAVVTIEKVGDVRRGEVIAVPSEKRARKLAETGQFAHVPAETPLGVPQEPPPAASSAPATQPVTTPRTSLATSTDDQDGEE